MEEPFLLTAATPSLRTTATFIEMRQLLVDEFCIHPTVVYILQLYTTAPL